MNIIQAVIFDLCKPTADLALFSGSPLALKKKRKSENETSAHASPDPFSHERLISRQETTPGSFLQAEEMNLNGPSLLENGHTLDKPNDAACSVRSMW